MLNLGALFHLPVASLPCSCARGGFPFRFGCLAGFFVFVWKLGEAASMPLSRCRGRLRGGAQRLHFGSVCDLLLFICYVQLLLSVPWSGHAAGLGSCCLPVGFLEGFQYVVRSVFFLSRVKGQV